MTFAHQDFRWIGRRSGSIAALLLATVLLAVVGCRHKPSVDPGDEPAIHETTFSFDQGIYPNELDLFPKYHVSPGDVLDVVYQIQRNEIPDFQINLYHTIRVKFVDLPNLNEEQQVLPDGTISLPYIGMITVIEKTPKQLQAELVELYRPILRNPELVVTVLDFNARIEQLRQDLHTATRGLSKLVTVRPDGYGTFPLIGEHMIARQTLEQVNADVQKKYHDFLPGLQADIFLHEQAGSVVYVLGEVRNAGAYEMRKPISLIQALTLAGGYSHEAELRNVIVFRQYEKKRIVRSVNLRDLTTVSAGATFFILRPDDIILVPRRRLANLAQVMGEIAGIALFQGWSVGYGLGDDVDWVGPNDPGN